MRAVVVLGCGVLAGAAIAAIGWDVVLEAIMLFVAVGIVPGTEVALSPQESVWVVTGGLAIILLLAARKPLMRLTSWPRPVFAAAAVIDEISWQRITSGGLRAVTNPSDSRYAVGAFGRHTRVL